MSIDRDVDVPKSKLPPIDGMWLNKSELKLLKKLHRKRKITMSQARRCLRRDRDTSATLTLRLKYLTVDEDGYISISKRGDNWIELHRQKGIEKWAPHIISAIALLISLVALFKP